MSVRLLLQPHFQLIKNQSLKALTLGLKHIIIQPQASSLVVKLALTIKSTMLLLVLKLISAMQTPKQLTIMLVMALATAKAQSIHLALCARAGYAIDRTLLYVTGGLAYANFSNRGYSNPTNGLGTEGQDSEGVKFGWTVGAGVEYALTGHISLKAESLYVDCAKAKGDGYYNGCCTCRSSFKHSATIARVGVNYKF